MSQNAIGPSLPPGFGSGGTCNNESDSNESSSDTEQATAIGPALPPNFHSNKVNNTDIGPVLPQSSNIEIDDVKSRIVMNDEEDDKITSSSTSNIRTTVETPVLCGVVSSSQMSYGPALPPGFKKSMEMCEEESDGGDDDDDDIIGPMPATGLEVTSTVASDFEARAEAMKNKLTGNVQEKVERESWMMELPEYSKNFGLGPRTFRKNAAPSNQDRSGWTETPADRERRMKEAQAKAMAAAAGVVPDSTSKQKQDEEKSKRDKEIEERISSYNSQSRGTSLVEMHQNERKRKMKEDGQSKERRPFNREVDLQVNRFDDAKKKRLIKESAKLNDKFAHGSDKVYL